MSFSVVPLSLPEKEIPAEARCALVENRLQDGRSCSCTITG